MMTLVTVCTCLTRDARALPKIFSCHRGAVFCCYPAVLAPKLLCWCRTNSRKNSGDSSLPFCNTCVGMSSRQDQKKEKNSIQPLCNNSFTGNTDNNVSHCSNEPSENSRLQLISKSPKPLCASESPSVG